MGASAGEHHHSVLDSSIGGNCRPLLSSSCARLTCSWGLIAQNWQKVCWKRDSPVHEDYVLPHVVRAGQVLCSTRRHHDPVCSN